MKPKQNQKRHPKIPNDSEIKSKFWVKSKWNQNETKTNFQSLKCREAQVNEVYLHRGPMSLLGWFSIYFE